MNAYKINPKVKPILMALAERELYQSSFYVQLASIANNLGFLKAEKYFQNESKEEKEHFMGHYEYVVGRGEDFQVPAIEMPKLSGKSLYELTELAKNIEFEVSDQYQDALQYVMSIDPMTYKHLQKYIKIQMEAVKFYIDACSTLDKLEKTGELVAESSVFQ